MDSKDKQSWGILVFGFVGLIVVTACARIPAIANVIAAVFGGG